MPINGRRLIIVTLFYLAVCGLTTLMIKPFSIINFIGPAAGVATAFTIIWGAKVLFSIIFATFIFSAILNVTMGETLSFPILLICLSAICLQSFWAKQLTYTMVSQQNWLKSRNVLFSFMLKIGPVAGLVSGSAVVVVSMIYMQTFGNSTLYIFVSSWSSSILSTIFITPILLFTQGKQELSTTKRLFVIFASILGFLAVTLLFKVSQNFHQHERIEKFQNSKAKVLNLFNEEVEMISEQILSTIALFQASDNVSAAEFSLFVSKIYRKNSSIRALEWIPEISHTNRDAFEVHASKELGFAYSIKEKNNSDQLLIADKRDNYLPVFYIYPKSENEKAFGLDLLNQSDRTIGLNLSFKLNQMIASAPLTLVQDKISNPGLLISYPIFNGKKLNVFSDEHKNEEKTLNGYILAV